MIIFTTEFYTPTLLVEASSCTFVFGDNSLCYGKGGQASIRDFKNTLGIPTKWAPDDREQSFYANDCYDGTLIEARLDQVGRLLAADLNVVIPGIFTRPELGTGLAQLPTRAPFVYDTIRQNLQSLALHFGHRDGL